MTKETQYKGKPRDNVNTKTHDNLQNSDIWNNLI